MKRVKVEEIGLGLTCAFLGWTGVHSGRMYNWGVAVPYPWQLGWALIVLGVSIPIVAYILRSRQSKDK